MGAPLPNLIAFRGGACQVSLRSLSTMSQEQKGRWNATRREKRAKNNFERRDLRTLELSRDVEVHRLEIEDIHSRWQRVVDRVVGEKFVAESKMRCAEMELADKKERAARSSHSAPSSTWGTRSWG